MGDAFLMRHRPKRMKRHKKDCRLFGSPHTFCFLCSRRLCALCALPALTPVSRKVPPSEPPAAVTGISFLSAYLFAMMYPSAPEKFLHPSDSSSPDLSRPCRHYSCSPVGESHPTSVSYPCCRSSSIRQFVHKSTLLRTNCE